MRPVGIWLKEEAPRSVDEGAESPSCSGNSTGTPRLSLQETLPLEPDPADHLCK